MTEPVTATFVGGPWDLHRVVLEEAPSRYYVPVMEAHPTASLRVFESGPLTEMVALKKAEYMRCDARVRCGEKYVVYLWEETR